MYFQVFVSHPKCTLHFIPDTAILYLPCVALTSVVNHVNTNSNNVHPEKKEKTWTFRQFIDIVLGQSQGF